MGIGGRGNFNDIITQEDKQGENKRGESSFKPFKEFISAMESAKCLLVGGDELGLTIGRGKGLLKRGLIYFLGQLSGCLSLTKLLFSIS